MALIPGYDYDIFISFDGENNPSSDGLSKSWIEQFYNSLNLMLARRCGQMDIVKIFRDNTGPGGTAISDNPVEKIIKKSAIFICLHSAGYTNSERCKSELSMFFTNAQNEKQGLRVGERSRILHVLLNNIPASSWPMELKGTRGFRFFKEKNDVDAGNVIDYPSEDFKTRIQGFSDIAWSLLSEFRIESGSDSGQHDGSDEQEEEPFIIYMGEVADTLRVSRNRIIAELKSKGFNVITVAAPPVESEAYGLAANAALQKANMAVNLLDEDPGNEFPDLPGTLVSQKQAELVMNSGKPQMIWVPDEINLAAIKQDQYRFFLQSLENGNASQRRYEFNRGNKSTLTRDIIDFAEHVKARQIPAITGKENNSVMVDAHYCDQHIASDLGRILLEHRIRPFINPQEDDPGKNLDLMGKRLSQVNKLVFIYGHVSKEWVEERMNAALELIITNHYPIRDFVIYMAPPAKKENDIIINQQFLKVNVIDNSNTSTLNIDGLQQLFNLLNNGK